MEDRLISDGRIIMIILLILFLAVAVLIFSYYGCDKELVGSNSVRMTIIIDRTIRAWAVGTNRMLNIPANYRSNYIRMSSIAPCHPAHNDDVIPRWLHNLTILPETYSKVLPIIITLLLEILILKKMQNF